MLVSSAYVKKSSILTLCYEFSNDLDAQSDFTKNLVTKKLVTWNHSYLQYNAPQKHDESTLLQYELNEYLTADRSCTTDYFLNKSYKSQQLPSLCFFWHPLRPNQSIIRGTVRLETFGRIQNRRHFPSKTAILPFSNIFQRLTVPRKID